MSDVAAEAVQSDFSAAKKAVCNGCRYIIIGPDRFLYPHVERSGPWCDVTSRPHQDLNPVTGNLVFRRVYNEERCGTAVTHHPLCSDLNDRGECRISELRGEKPPLKFDPKEMFGITDVKEAFRKHGKTICVNCAHRRPGSNPDEPLCGSVTRPSITDPISGGKIYQPNLTYEEDLPIGFLSPYVPCTLINKDIDTRCASYLDIADAPKKPLELPKKPKVLQDVWNKIRGFKIPGVR